MLGVSENSQKSGPQLIVQDPQKWPKIDPLETPFLDPPKTPIFDEKIIKKKIKRYSYKIY